MKDIIYRMNDIKQAYLSDKNHELAVDIAKLRTKHWTNVPHYPLCLGNCCECHRIRFGDKHCINCDAKMIEPQESEDKNE